MKLHHLFTAALVALSATLAVCISNAAIVDPYTENFPSSSAQWIDGPQTGFATWQSSNGPDGTSGYISASINTVSNATNSSRILFRGNSTTSPSVHASNDEFAGDWLAGGINHFSAWVYHEAPVALPYFARFATPTGFPGTAAVEGTLVQPFTWTKLDYIINPNQIGLTVTPETQPPATDLDTFNSTFTNVGRVQIGFSTPASMASSATSYLYALDQVSVSIVAVPEPSSSLLVLSGLGMGLIRRRRRAA